MYIGVYAYGESRFDLTFNPCNANIASLCPMNASVPIVASGIIPVAQSDVAGIPAIALTIPDFEGEAILRIFANSTETEIACYSAVVTNGNTFSQPAAVGTILGIFTLVAVVASFATAVYGDSIPVIRTHYAHSLSVLVVFAVFQHIFFTGALSMNWPSVLVAWWSNFAWAGGMIYSSSMQSSINHLIGNNVGNTSEVGAAGSGSTQESLGGGYDISQIYKRGLSFYKRDFSHLSQMLKKDVASDIYRRDHSQMLKRDVISRTVEQVVQRRDLANSSSGYHWYGQPVGSGLPLPGNYSGFAGTLAEEGIRVSNAFMTGFLWFLILLVLIAAAVIAFKWVVEAFVAIKLLRKDRLGFFRQHWIRYTGLAALRTLFIGFFMMMLLTMFQFSYESGGGVKAIAAIIFVLLLVGMPGCVAYAFWYRVHTVGTGSKSEQAVEQTLERSETDSPGKPSKLSLRKFGLSKSPASFSFRELSQLGSEPGPIHDDEEYVKKFGWLSARFRRSRWWFFAAWIFYEFIRACFYAGASGHPMTQVFGLLIVETLAFAAIVWARPFEATRLNILVVYCLGFSKVTTVALSAAFDVNFNLPRITTTVIGVVIIVIQGILTIITLIAIVVGAISSYMSMTRNRDEFRPRKLMGIREKYFQHIDQAATDQRPPPPPVEVYEEPKGPYFNVNSIRRVAKIEDEDPEFVAELAMHEQEPTASYTALSQRSKTPLPDMFDVTSTPAPGPSRTRATSRASMRSYTNLPYGARPHRPSWTSRDFEQWQNENVGTSINMDRQVPDDESATATSTRLGARTPTRAATLPLAMLKPMASMDSMRLGGDVSSRDVIGNVPSPNVRPRSGTFGGRGSRSNTPVSISMDAPAPPLPSNSNSLSVAKRGKGVAVIPTEEVDEDLSK